MMESYLHAKVGQLSMAERNNDVLEHNRLDIYWGGGVVC